MNHAGIIQKHGIVFVADRTGLADAPEFAFSGPGQVDAPLFPADGGVKLSQGQGVARLVRKAPTGREAEGPDPHKAEEPPGRNTALSPQEKQTLLKIARSSIEDSCRHQPAKPVEVSENLKTPLGAFVTLHKNGRLRGCIGHFGEDIPLYKTVSQMARSAAFEDPRFPAVTSDEMKDIEIEVSVLTPLKRINDISEFKYGQQGIYMRKGYRSGTFLPQVAHEVNWTKEEFLGHCAQDKAGIGWYGWKDAELYTYEAILFEE
jgi:AmmeMemoRadiSam system protein A